jgi:DNA-binding NarL/FixJ family response regulator
MRVMVVADNVVLREAVVHLLDADAGLDVVGQAGTGVAVPVARSIRPDLVIVDEGVRSPARAVPAALRQAVPRTRVVLLVAHGDPHRAHAPLPPGVDAVVAPGGGSDDLMALIHRLGTWCQPERRRHRLVVRARWPRRDRTTVRVRRQPYAS